MVKQFVELNTDLDFNGTTYVPELNGRQGDNNREVYFFIKKGVRPFDLSDKTVTLFMKDAVGGVKTASTINDRAGITAGRFSLLIPKEFYQAEGDTQESFLQIKKDDTVLTTIPLAFKVIANGMSVTQSQSTVYINSVQKILNDLAPRIESTTAGVEANQNAMRALTANIDALNQAYNIDLLAKKTKDNEFTGKNTFSDVDINGKLTVNNSVVMEKSVETNGDIDTNGKFTGHQKSYFLNGLAINGGGIFVKDGSNLTGDNFLDNATISSYLTVKGNQELKGHANVMSGIYVEGGINSKDNVDIYGKTVTHGETVIDGKIDFNKDLNTHSDVNIFGNVNMTKVREADIYDNGLNGHLVRVGNVVMIRMYGGILFDHPSFTKLLWDIPVGFRPVAETDLLASVGFSKGLIKIFPDGSAWNIDTTFKVADNNGGDGVPFGFGCWVTTDGFPA